MKLFYEDHAKCTFIENVHFLPEKVLALLTPSQPEPWNWGLNLKHRVAFANIHEIHVSYPYLISYLKGQTPFPKRQFLNCPGTEGTIALIQGYKFGYSQIILRHGFISTFKWLSCVVYLKHMEKKKQNINYWKSTLGLIKTLNSELYYSSGCFRLLACVDYANAC